MQQYGLWKVYFPESFFVACYRANARDREEAKRIRGCTASKETTKYIKNPRNLVFLGFFDLLYNENKVKIIKNLKER